MDSGAGKARGACSSLRDNFNSTIASIPRFYQFHDCINFRFSVTVPAFQSYHPHPSSFSNPHSPSFRCRSAAWRRTPNAHTRRLSATKWAGARRQSERGCLALNIVNQIKENPCRIRTVLSSWASVRASTPPPNPKNVAACSTAFKMLLNKMDLFLFRRSFGTATTPCFNGTKQQAASTQKSLHSYQLLLGGGLGLSGGGGGGRGDGATSSSGLCLLLSSLGLGSLGCLLHLLHLGTGLGVHA